MVKEDYCTEGLVKLLLEKGCPLDKVMKQDRRPVYFSLPTDHPNWADCDAYYIPTHAQAMKWLREAHKLSVEITSTESGRWMTCVYQLGSARQFFKAYVDICDTYEEAVEDAVKHSLENLI